MEESGAGFDLREVVEDLDQLLDSLVRGEAPDEEDVEVAALAVKEDVFGAKGALREARGAPE